MECDAVTEEIRVKFASSPQLENAFASSPGGATGELVTQHNDFIYECMASLSISTHIIKLYIHILIYTCNYIYIYCVVMCVCIYIYILCICTVLYMYVLYAEIL